MQTVTLSPAAKVALKVSQGESVTNSFIFHDGDETDPVLNLTGYSARLQVRPSVDSDTTYLDLTTTNGKLVIDALNGKVSLNLAPADTDGADWSEGVYDLELVSSGGQVTRYLEGRFILDRNVTR